MLSFGSDEVWPSLLKIGIALAVITIIVGLVVWIGRRRGSRTIALDAALTLSGWWILLSAVGVVVILVKAFTADWAELHGDTTYAWVPWPEGLDCSTIGETSSTMLICGSQPLTDFTVVNASLGLRLLAAAAQSISLALSTIPAIVVALVCFHTLRGRPFSRIVSRALTGAAIAILVLGVTVDLVASVASTAGLREALPVDSAWYPVSYQLTVTPWPFAAALGLLALAAVFRQGMRLDQDRARLQQETERLQKDTEGLV